MGLGQLPIELFAKIVVLLAPTDAIAVAQVSTQLAARCAMICLQKARLDLLRDPECTLATQLRQRFAGVQQWVFNVPRDRLVCPVRLMRIAGPATSVEIWGGAMKPTLQVERDETLESCTRLALCPRISKAFKLPLERMVTPALGKLYLRSWSGTEQQWTELLGRIPQLRDFGAENCTGFAIQHCTQLFATCRRLRTAYLAECARNVQYRDVLEAAAAATELQSLQFDRPRSQVEDDGGVRLEDIQRYAAVFRPLQAVGICDTPMEDDVVYWLYDNCPHLTLCFTNCRASVHQSATIRRASHHPRWPTVFDGMTV